MAKIATGTILGPILLGKAFPHLHGEIFGAGVLSGLRALSDLGVALSMSTADAELTFPSRGGRVRGPSSST